MADLVSIGIAYDTSQLTAGSRQVQTAMQQLTQAEKQTQTASEQLANTSTKTAQALAQEGQAATQAASATSQVTQSASQAASSLTRTASAATQAAQATGEMGQQARGASGFLQTLLNQALAFGGAQVGMQAVSQALSSLKDAASGAVQSAIRLESLQATFKAISGSAQAAEKDMGFLRGTAQRLGIGFGDLAKGFQQMAAAAQNTSVQGQGVRDIFTAIAEKGRVLGLSAQEIQGAMLAVSQSFSKGTIQAEELRGQFSERMPGAINEMARALGVGTAELNKMMEAGQLGITAWQSWAAVVRTDLGGATAEAAKTAGAAIARLGNDMERFKEAVGQFLLPGVAAGVNALERLATKALAAMDAMGKTVKAQKDFEAAQTREPTTPGGAERGTELGRIQERIRLLQQEQVMRKANLGESPIIPSGTEAELKALEARRDALLKEQQRLTTSQSGDEERRRAAARSIELGNLQQRNTFLETGRTLLAQQRKEEEAMASAKRTGLGRDPTAEEKVNLQEKQLKDAQEFLQTNPKLAEQYKDDPVVKALRERGKATEAASTALDDAKQARKDADRDAAAAEKEQERLDKERRSNIMATGKLVLDGYEKEGEFIAQLHERVRALTLTEEERLALQAQAIEDPALRAYAEELVKQVEAAKDFNDQLRERNKLLGDQASVSAGTLSDLQRLQKSLEPRQRGQTLQQQLAAKRKEIETIPGLDAEGRRFALAQADEQIKKTLDTEIWAKWTDVAEESLDKVGDAITQFAFHGKLTFKDMVTSIAEDFFRMSLKMLSQSALSAAGGTGGGGAGGWLDLALKAGTSLLSAFSGGKTLAVNPTNVPTGWSVVPAMQGGGAVQAGQPYWVGEAGPELVVPKQSGTILPHGQGMPMAAPTVIVNVHGVQDAQSFIASRGAVQRGIAGAVSQAYRGL